MELLRSYVELLNSADVTFHHCLQQCHRYPLDWIRHGVDPDWMFETILGVASSNTKDAFATPLRAELGAAFHFRQPLPMLLRAAFAPNDFFPQWHRDNASTR